MTSPLRRSATSSPASGFTLVELLVTMAVMSLVMLGLNVTLQSTVFTHDDLAIDMAQVREGPRILDMIERDLRSLHTYNIKDKAIFRGESVRHIAARGDRIDFLTTVDSARRINDPHAPWDNPRMIASDITEVGYRVKPRPDNPEFLELYRREDLFVDDRPLEGGTYERIHDRIVFFEIRYLTALGEDGDEEEEWSIEERKRLPAAIVVQLELYPHAKVVGEFVETRNEANKSRYFRRIIPLDPGMNTAMAVRPSRPVLIDENDVSAGAGGGGGGGAAGSAEDGAMGGEGGGRGRGGEGGGDGRGGPGGGPGGGRGGSSLIDFAGGGMDDGGRIREGLKNGFEGNGDFNLEQDQQEMMDSWLDQYQDKYGDGN